MVGKLNVPTTIAKQACFYKMAFNTLLPDLLGFANERDVLIDELVGEPLTRNKLTGIESWVTDALVYKEGSSIPLGAVKTPKIGKGIKPLPHIRITVFMLALSLTGLNPLKKLLQMSLNGLLTLT